MHSFDKFERSVIVLWLGEMCSRFYCEENDLMIQFRVEINQEVEFRRSGNIDASGGQLSWFVGHLTKVAQLAGFNLYGPVSNSSNFSLNDLVNLVWLFLNGNMIVTLDEKLFARMVHLNSLYLSDNICLKF